VLLAVLWFSIAVSNVSLAWRNYRITQHRAVVNARNGTIC